MSNNMEKHFNKLSENRKQEIEKAAREIICLHSELSELKEIFDDFIRKREIYDETGIDKESYYDAYENWINRIEEFFSQYG